jgi:hypothetical protein
MTGPSLENSVRELLTEHVRLETAGIAEQPADDRHGVIFKVAPRNELAAPMSLHVAGPSEIEVTVGIASTFGYSSSDERTLLDAVADVVDAVVAGRFSEETWLRGDVPAKAHGEVRTTGGVMKARYRNMATRGRGKTVHERRSYAAY